MSGRGHGRGNINMTQAELTDLINTRVAEALAAYQAGTECTKSARATPTQPTCLYIQNVHGL
ncbi:hypothetical protein HanPSC8_Chr13g0571151 [Helianthus annuus]|nr:hypothetical protein HanPSC8_Chr13g0571151 [Helianthus annuus]